MKEFLEKLRQQVAENPPNYGDADSVLGLLYECFNENNPYDSEQIKADFEELYRQIAVYKRQDQELSDRTIL